jgi:hypothetical protein
MLRRVFTCPRSASSFVVPSLAILSSLAACRRCLNITGKQPWNERKEKEQLRIVIPNAIYKLEENFHRPDRFAPVAAADQREQQNQLLVAEAAEASKVLAVRLTSLADELEAIDKSNGFDYLLNNPSSSSSGGGGEASSKVNPTSSAQYYQKLQSCIAQLRVASERCNAICKIAAESSSSSGAAFDQVESEARAVFAHAVRFSRDADEIKEFVEVHVLAETLQRYDDDLAKSEKKIIELKERSSSGAAGGWTDTMDGALDATLGFVLKPLKPFVTGGGTTTK